VIVRLLLAELRKLNGSLAMLLAIVSPALVGLLCFLGAFAGDRAPSWSEVMGMMTLQVWGFFLLPMTVTAFTALVAQIEYKSRAWDHLLALPVPRWGVYLTKAAAVAVAVAAMTALVFAFAWLGSVAGGTVSGRMPTGELPWDRIARGGAAVVCGAGLMVMLQLWVALRFANFVVPLGFGIAGTLVAISVLVMRTEKADLFPWLLPVNAVMKPEPAPYLLLGGLGGLAVLLLMVLDLSRREMR
jgi:ABC-2 type transport system permease protein